MKRFLRVASFAVALVALAIYFSACGSGGSDSGDRVASAIYAPGTAATLQHTAPLIAGGGQGFVVGGPQECGSVTFTSNGDGSVTCTYQLNAGWYFNGLSTNNLALYVDKAGATLPKTMAPGKFQYQGSATPDVEGGTGSITTGALSAGTKYNFAAHANVYSIEEVPIPDCIPSLGSAGGCTLGLVNANEDGVLSFGMYQGPDNNDQGTVDMWVDNGNLNVEVTSNTCDLIETQMYIGTDVPDNNAGSWNYKSGDGDGVATNCGWLFTVPLSSLEIVPSCGEDCSGSGLSGLNFAVHMSDELGWDEFGNPILGEDGNQVHESSTGWTSACRVINQPGGNPWKSYDSCVLSFECNNDPPVDPQDCYDEVPSYQSAYGFDNTVATEPDATAANEAGWFRNFGYSNWGWFIQILR